MWTVTGKFSPFLFCLVHSYFEDMNRSRVIVENLTVWASLVARPRLISLGWMIYTLTVRPRASSQFLIANVPVLLALGISDEVEMLGLKGSKKRKSKKLDEDYMVCLASALVLSVPQLFVLSARAQTST